MAKQSEPLYRWVGLDAGNNRVSGEIEGDSEAFVRAMLRRRNIKPLEVKQRRGVFGIGGGVKRKKIKAADISVFSRQMATMLDAGLPVVDALTTIARSVDNRSMADMINNIRSGVEAGEPFGQALERYPKHFDALFVNLVKAGEEAGALDTILEKIATYKEKTEAIKAKVRKALFYPSAVAVVAFTVVVIMLIYVVPQFQSLFNSFGSDLPAFTLLVIELSDAMQANWYLVVGTLVAGGLAFRRARKTSSRFHKLCDRALLRAPVVGNIIYKASVARFARTTATMFAAGVPLVEALTSVARTAGNRVFEDKIIVMQEQVETGTQFYMAMENAAVFPTMATQMVAIGEEAGAVDTMCNKVAGFYEQEVDEAVDALSSLLEPLIMVVVGGLVGAIIVAMYLPIFKLGSVV